VIGDQSEATLNSCVINFAKGSWYPRGQERLLRSLQDVGYQDPVYAWQDESSLGAPLHAEVPYAFKISAFNFAAERGHRLVLWCDAAVWATRPLDPIFEHIRREGHVFFDGGYNCAQWTSDACLGALGVSRDEAEGMPMYMACCMGLDLANERSREFLRRLTEKASDGASFPGAWTNEDHAVSGDPRCRGHRHDQSAGSIIAWQLGMAQTIGHETHFRYYQNVAGTPYQYGEENDMEGIRESVVLLSQGM
jgi:hypothetical protein